MEKIYNKLVRDRIPEIIQDDKGIPVIRELSSEEYWEYLLKKVIEELKEVKTAISKEERKKELADMLELIRAMAVYNGNTLEDIINTADKKRETNGGFSEMIKGYTMLVKPKAQMIKIKFLRQANLLWKKVKNASGYEVYRSESKKGKYVKVRTVLKSKAINYYRDKNLKKNKSYYYKIRAYKTIDGKKIYSDYSAVKTARM